MKKIIALLLVLVMVFALAACTKNNGEDGNTNEGENTDIGENTDDENTDEEASVGFDYMAANLTEYIKLGNYKGLTGTKSSTVVTDEFFEEQLNKSLSSYSDYEKVTDRAVIEGDTVVLDYSGSVDGVDFGGGTALNQEIVAADDNGYIPGFGSGIIGHVPGDSFDITVTFPDPYPNNTDLSGKEAVFHMDLHYIVGEAISVMSIDNLTDTFVNSNFDFETVEEFLRTEREYMETVAPYNAAQELYAELWAQIVDDSEVIKYPDGLVETIKNDAMEYYEYYASYYGVDVETFMQSDGLTPDTLVESIESSVKDSLVLYSLVKELDAEVSDAEVEGKIAYIADLNHVTSEELLSYYGEDQLKDAAQYDKVMGMIEKMGNITYTDAE